MGGYLSAGRAGTWEMGAITRLVLELSINTLRTGDADLRFYITTVQDG